MEGDETHSLVRFINNSLDILSCRTTRNMLLSSNFEKKVTEVEVNEEDWKVLLGQGG